MPSSGLSTQATVVDRSESDDEMPLVREACQANEGVPSTIPAESIPTWVDRDADECSVSSEFCWGEQEDLIGEEIPEWGVLPCLASVVPPVEDCNTRAVVPHRLASRRLVLVGGGSQSQNRYSPLAHEDENEADHNQDAIQFVADTVSSKRSRQSELQVTVPVEHSQPTCPVVDMTQEDSVSEARSDSGLSSVLNALEADLDRPEASESDTESLRLPHRRRLVIRSTPQLQQPNEQVDSRGAVLFVPVEIGMRRGLESLDMVDIAEVFSVRAVVMKSVPRFLAGAFRGALKAGLQEICKGRAANNVVVEERGWKLFLLIPRLLLWRPPRGGLVPRRSPPRTIEAVQRRELGLHVGEVSGGGFARDGSPMQETSDIEGHIGEKGCQGHGTCTVGRVVQRQTCIGGRGGRSRH